MGLVAVTTDFGAFSLLSPFVVIFAFFLFEHGFIPFPEEELKDPRFPRCVASLTPVDSRNSYRIVLGGVGC